MSVATDVYRLVDICGAAIKIFLLLLNFKIEILNQFDSSVFHHPLSPHASGIGWTQTLDLGMGSQVFNHCATTTVAIYRQA
jgi:hypothetical protein